MTEGCKRLMLDLPQVDSLLDFLVDIRQNMAPKQTADAATHGIRVGRPEDTAADRIARMREHALGMEAILGELKESSQDQLATILAMTRMINAGDMTVELIYGPEDETEVNVH
ncbi:hypothetical protein HFO56_01995 [Rhizobium laguerreae]|uniref:hypothetical protein n=1 Tax=Rhizobium laguerreae TaxID=1076926 RepID=UPI001C91D7F9|nr:hypothetical protein [Rhizobium laguerreae]MBY3151179.1 hypothetical protein [Rhizobium laguerreae]